jgi:hypothetical protein
MPEQLRLNPIWNTDSYKLTTLVRNILPDTQYIESHLMSRGGFWKHTLFQGLQGILKAHYTGVVFTEADVEEARMLSALHFGTDGVQLRWLAASAWRSTAASLPLRDSRSPSKAR